MFYLLFLLPLFFSLAALKTGYYPFKALVTISCLAIIGAARFAPGGRSGWAAPIVIAFGFSVMGDFFLSTRGDQTGSKRHYYLLGILFFFLAHLAYLAFASRLGVLNRPILLLILVLFLVYYAVRLYPRLEKTELKIAVLLYLILSCFSLAWVISLGCGSLRSGTLIGGIALIFFSDLTIAESDFCGVKAMAKWILPTYYAAHMILTFGVVLVL